MAAAVVFARGPACRRAAVEVLQNLLDGLVGPLGALERARWPCPRRPGGACRGGIPSSPCRCAARARRRRRAAAERSRPLQLLLVGLRPHRNISTRCLVQSAAMAVRFSLSPSVRAAARPRGGAGGHRRSALRRGWRPCRRHAGRAASTRFLGTPAGAGRRRARALDAAAHGDAASSVAPAVRHGGAVHAGRGDALPRDVARAPAHPRQATRSAFISCGAMPEALQRHDAARHRRHRARRRPRRLRRREPGRLPGRGRRCTSHRAAPDIAVTMTGPRLRRRGSGHLVRRDRGQPRAERRRRRDPHRRHPLRRALRAHRRTGHLHPRRHPALHAARRSPPARAACSPSCWQAAPRARASTTP